MDLAIETIAIMKQQEMTHYRASNYLAQNRVLVTVNDRTELCQWGFDIVRICHIDPSIAVIGISLFDRFLSHYESRIAQYCLLRRREFQLAFILCLMIAMKAHAGIAVKPRFISEDLCDGMYNDDEITQMEIEVLRSLSWRLNGPTAIDFIHSFMELLPSTIENTVAMSLAELSKSNAENAMLDYISAIQAPSIIALASIKFSFQALDLPLLYSKDIRTWMMQCTTLAWKEDWQHHHNDMLHWRHSGVINTQLSMSNDYVGTESLNFQVSCSEHEEVDFDDECHSIEWVTSLGRNRLNGKRCQVLSSAA